MFELPASQISIQDTFWTPRLMVNAQVTIYQQWQQLESTRCIDNFRLAAGKKDGFREGWFFADSDAFKWLDAAARVYSCWPLEDLRVLMSNFIGLLGEVQMEDGYLFTYNQIHFPGERWGNLMIEHELYCHGHLIEAGVSHFEATGEKTALHIASTAADLLVKDFLKSGPDRTSGHEEVEIALLRLYGVTHRDQYLELASQFLERRGKDHLFSLHVLAQNVRVARRTKIVQDQRRNYLARHPEPKHFTLPADNFAKKPRYAKLRWLVSALTGKYFQQHVPIRNQTVPVGHSVRFAYLETAIAMLHRLKCDGTLLSAQKMAWEHMVNRRMYITGGIGSLPELEGFGRDYELDPETAYAETCAALGSLFWNWEMLLNTGEACYSDLFEWQLYNAAAVGMGLGGDSYLYNNPLACQGGVTRRPWFRVPCCPSNLSRTWASLGKYIYSYDEKNLWVNQYIGNQMTIPGRRWEVQLVSDLPWTGKVSFSFDQVDPSNFIVYFRIPSWANVKYININGRPFTPAHFTFSSVAKRIRPTGIDPHQSWFLPVQRDWLPGDVVDLFFEMPILLHSASPRTRGLKGKIALSRGPLVYCLESVDNPNMDIFNSRIDTNSIQAESAPALLGGIWVLRGKLMDDKEFTAIPYYLWANRGESQMTVWISD
jgi:uncharacterized protein